MYKMYIRYRAFQAIINIISRSCSAAEENYTITKLELLAVVWVCRTFRPHILLRPFLLRMDHGSLR